MREICTKLGSLHACIHFHALYVGFTEPPAFNKSTKHPRNVGAAPLASMVAGVCAAAARRAHSCGG